MNLLRIKNRYDHVIKYICFVINNWKRACMGNTFLGINIKLARDTASRPIPFSFIYLCWSTMTNNFFIKINTRDPCFTSKHHQLKVDFFNRCNSKTKMFAVPTAGIFIIGPEIFAQHLNFFLSFHGTYEISIN